MDRRVIGERSDAVLWTAVPGDDTASWPATQANREVLQAIRTEPAVSPT